MKRYLFIAVGLIAASIGIIGVWVPGLPTTFPTLVAIWAFGKSSPRLQAALLKLPILSAAVREASMYEQYRTVTLKAKIISQTSAWLSVVLVAAVTGSWLVTGIVASLALTCTWFMVRTPLRTAEQERAATRVA